MRLPNSPDTDAFHPGASSGEVEVEGILLHSLLPAPLTMLLLVSPPSRGKKASELWVPSRAPLGWLRGAEPPGAPGAGGGVTAG